MLPSVSEAVTPASYEELAALLAEAAAAGRTVLPAGGGTKRSWGRARPDPELTISTARLDRVVEYNPADLTAVVQAGVRLDDLRAALGERGQMLALDPPTAGAATLGGIVATADSGPLRHSAGGVRDLLLGVTVALSDGTVARAGGKVIKNVAGYDLAKLYAGSFGTLGVILEFALRLHPIPAERRTVVARSANPAAVPAAVAALVAEPLALRAFDVAWAGGTATVLAEAAGPGAGNRAHAAGAVLAAAGFDVEEAEDAAPAWEAQRGAQRSGDATVVRVSALPAEIGRVLTALPPGASLVGRAGLGLSWVRLAPGPDAEVARAVTALRGALAPRPCVVLDAPPGVREQVEVWGPADPVKASLDRRVKERFDPPGVLNPGILHAAVPNSGVLNAGVP